MNMIAIRILATFSTMMWDVSGLADLLIFLWAQTLLLGGWLGRVWARRLIIGQNLRSEVENILFHRWIFLLPGAPCILLSILKLQNIFIRIIFIRHCLQGICSAEIISVRFISITAARNILQWMVRMLFRTTRKSLNSIDKVVVIIQHQLQAGWIVLMIAISHQPTLTYPSHHIQWPETLRWPHCITTKCIIWLNSSWMATLELLSISGFSHLSSQGFVLR